MKTIILAILIVGLSGCTQPDHAEKVLLDAGYSHIEITNYRPFACDSKDDIFATGFTAIGPTGRNVSGVVCEGFFKNATIRLD